MVAPAEPAAGYEVPLADLMKLSENAVARAQYASLLAYVGQLLRAHKLPDQNEQPTDRALRALHASLAAEVYKATELIGALCAFAMEDPPKQFMRIMNVKQEEANAFYSALSGAPTNDEVRAWFPLFAPIHPPVQLTAEEQKALLLNDDALCGMLREAVLLAKAVRTYLAPFRNRFSHTYGLILFGAPSSQSKELFLPNIATQVIAKADGTIGMIDGVLIATPENDQALLSLLELFLQAEELLVQARVYAVVHGMPALVPKFMVRKDAGVAAADYVKHYETAWRKLGFKNIEAQVTLNFEIKVEHEDKARAFYAMLSKTSFGAPKDA